MNKILGKSGKVIKFCKKVKYFTLPKRWVILRETSTFDRFMTFMSDLIQFFWLDCSLSQFWFSNYNFGLPLFKSNELKKKKIMIGLKLKKINQNFTKWEHEVGKYIIIWNIWHFLSYFTWWIVCEYLRFGLRRKKLLGFK